MSGKVLCAVDLGHPEQEREVLRRAAQLAALDDAELDVLTVTPDYGEGFVSSFFDEGAQARAIDHASAALHSFVRETLGPDARVRHVVACGSVYAEIIATAEKIGASLIVLGAHRPDLRDFLLGPNAARVASHAKSSVHIVRPPRTV